jgi:hypothetical protein
MSRELRWWKVALLLSWAMFAAVLVLNAASVSAGWYCT